MGYPLLRTADCPRVNAFLNAIADIEDTDLLDPARLAVAIDEAEQFYVYGLLNDLFEAIGHRDELADAAFDRNAAAGALRLYLGG